MRIFSYKTSYPKSRIVYIWEFLIIWGIILDSKKHKDETKILQNRDYFELYLAWYNIKLGADFHKINN